MSSMFPSNRLILPLLLLTGIVCTLVSTPMLADEPVVPQELQGLWKVVRLESAKPFPEGLADRIKLEFTESALIVHSGLNAKEFEVKFEKKPQKTSKKPAAFAMAEKEGNQKGQQGRVLYRMGEDGKLTVCVPNGPDKEGEPPINDFEAGKKSARHLILIMQKVTAKKDESK